MPRKILLLTGMPPDPRIFVRLLPRLPSASIIPWIQPKKHESIHNYSRRLANTLAIEDQPIVCGVSFGGLISQELASILNAKACVLSARE